ncbi:MAG: aldehyde dehydrogenase [Bryobacterales bacterium]|nr:aldehyde dehydrogenase [Bryobacterales bacterium]
MQGILARPETQQPSSGRYSGFDSMPIAGQWRQGRSQKRIQDVDPYRGDVLASITGATADDVDEAYNKAAEAQRGWAPAPLQFRRGVVLRALEILNERKEEIIDLLIREAGSTRAKAEIEFGMTHEYTMEASTYPFRMEGEVLPIGVPGKQSRVFRQPVGVVGVISPWDFSLHLSNRSVTPALAAGNAVVLKPASTTPITGGLLFGKIYEEAGLPPGVLSVVVGGGEEIGDPFVEHPVPRMVTFTGSTEVGRNIGMLCGKHLKRVELELGGNAPFIALADADLDQAVNIAVVGKFLNSGQICIAINRIIVDKKIHDQFLERFTKRVKALKWGDPMRPETDMGPIIDKKQFDNIRKLVDETVKAGARVVLDGPSEGLVMHPVILADVTNDMPAAKKEIFGPVAVILKADGGEDALRIANDTQYGLSSAICTRDLWKGSSLAKRIEAGMTHVNDISVQDEANSPFGGEKQSGLGRFGGRWALEEFTTVHWITVQETPRQYPF